MIGHWDAPQGLAIQGEKVNMGISAVVPAKLESEGRGQNDAPHFCGSPLLSR
jgi:hypothetical protein